MKNFFLISVYFILVCILNVNGRYAICLSPRFIKIFRDLYDDNKDDHLTPDQKAILFTSMVVQPESLMLRVCSVLLCLFVTLNEISSSSSSSSVTRLQ